MADLFTERPATALAVYAHPDDADVSCGATLAGWAAAGAAVHVAVLTQGDKGSHDARADSSRLADRRSDEVAAAAQVLGLAGHHLLGYPDGEFENDVELRRRLVALVRAIRPEVVVAPDPTAVFFGTAYFNHRDHRVTGWAALDAVCPAAGSPLYFPAEGAPHQVSTVLLSGSLEPSVYVDVGDHIAVKTQAVLCHRTQVDAERDVVDAVVRTRAEEAGRAAGVRYAEGFRLLRLG